MRVPVKNYIQNKAYLQGSNQPQATAHYLVHFLESFIPVNLQTPLYILDIGAGDGTFTFIYSDALKQSIPDLMVTAIEPEIPAYNAFAQKVKNCKYDWIKHHNTNLQDFLKGKVGNETKFNLNLFAQSFYHFPRQDWSSLLEGTTSLLRNDGLTVMMLDSHNSQAYSLKDKLVRGKPATLEFGYLHSAEDVEQFLTQRKTKYKVISFPVHLFIRDDERKVERLARHLSFLYRLFSEDIISSNKTYLETMLRDSRRIGDNYILENRVKIIIFKK